MHQSLLTRLADAYGSDKGFAVGDRHCYTFLYDILFSGLRGGALTMVELGLARGGPEGGGPVERSVDSPSVRMWLDYFPRAELYGFDISDFSHLASDRFHFFRGDSGSVDDLNRFRAFIPGEADIIIDDASHASFHQQLALRLLFDKVKPGGLYIIEDLHWQPEHFERALPPVPKTEAFIRGLCLGQKHSSVVWDDQALDSLTGLIDSAVVINGLEVPGSRYRNSLAVIRKKGTPLV